MIKTIFLVLVSFALLGSNYPLTKGQINSHESHLDQDQESTSDDFQNYWNDFRKAVINSDSLNLKDLTNFPLKTHGFLDQDPQFHIKKEKFYYFFKVCLNSSTGMSSEPETNLDLIKRTIKLEKGLYYTRVKNWCRVSGFEFNKINNQWKLTLIYFNTVSYNYKE
jgi:hypothetical protein